MGRRLGDVGHIGRAVAEALSQADEAEQRVVVRVQERAHGEPGRRVPLRLEPAQQLDRLARGERVLDRAGVVLAEPVRLRPDPLREAVVVEQVGLPVALDVVRERRPVVIDRQQRPIAVLSVEVGVGGVPLALVVGPVAAGPEPVAERRHRVRGEPRHLRPVGGLGEPVGLGHPVQRGVLAGEQRGATRRAGRRHRIVVAEGDALAPQPLDPRHRLRPKPRQLRRLIRRREAQLVGEDHENVRSGHRRLRVAGRGGRSHTQGPTPAAPPCAHASRQGGRRLRAWGGAGAREAGARGARAFRRRPWQAVAASETPGSGGSYWEEGPTGEM